MDDMIKLSDSSRPWLRKTPTTRTTKMRRRGTDAGHVPVGRTHGAVQEPAGRALRCWPVASGLPNRQRPSATHFESSRGCPRAGGSRAESAPEMSANGG